MGEICMVCQKECRGGFEVYVGLEGAAHTIRMYESELVPGLLQTPDYAREVFRAFRSEDVSDDIERPWNGKGRNGDAAGKRLELNVAKSVRPARKHQHVGRSQALNRFTMAQHPTERDNFVDSKGSRELLEDRPFRIGLSNSGQRVTALWDGAQYLVFAINTANGHLLAKIAVGVQPHGLCVWPQPGRYSLGHTGITR